mmetsp:Transcript_15400/g.1382  ORF Transcript_15400/g.1382 Transcript_15400/m.1382 type:complete len:102 (+) Transcript_15400:35-340(+)
MNKKIFTGIFLILGVIALIAVLSNNNASVNLISKHNNKKHNSWWNRGCDPSDAYTKLCTDNNGTVCEKNLYDNAECCAADATCEDKSKSVWGYTKTWKACS